MSRVKNLNNAIFVYLNLGCVKEQGLLVFFIKKTMVYLVFVYKIINILISILYHNSKYYVYYINYTMYNFKKYT